MPKLDCSFRAVKHVSGRLTTLLSNLTSAGLLPVTMPVLSSTPATSAARSRIVRVIGPQRSAYMKLGSRSSRYLRER